MTAQAPPAATLNAAVGDLTSQNIDAVVDFYVREDEKITASQRLLERTSLFLGNPACLAIILGFVALWIIVNLLLPSWRIAPFDVAPYAWLQGIVGLSALLTAAIVLARQNRLAGLAEKRAHLDLKVNLLTEQKVAKLIHLVEELRRDPPNVRDRHDAHALAMQEPMNPDAVLATLDEARSPLDRPK